ncbi:hypothetical protein HU200_022104 [Digitaria exilis]|uniref:FAR1 domain-containing protein n=1 Tax=Digitaria exilis TaxID=1010633 RepID=A0A835EXR8_9POAL|nr:hypothetical protein HU200_022104 [Digitaria exilis]
MEEETIPKSNRRKRMEQIWDKSDGEARIVPECIQRMEDRNMQGRQAVSEVSRGGIPEGFNFDDTSLDNNAMETMMTSIIYNISDKQIMESWNNIQFEKLLQNDIHFEDMGMQSSFEQISYNQFDGMQHRPETSPLCNEQNLVSQEESNCYMSDRAEMRLAYEHDLHVTTSRTAEAELVPLVCDRHLLTTTYSSEQLQMSNKSHEDAYVSIEEQSLAEFENNNTSAAVKGTGVPQSGVNKIISFAGTTTAEKHIENSQEIFEMFNHSQNMACFEMNITTATNVGQGQENVVGEEEIELFEHNYGLTRELTPPPAVAGEGLDDDITEEDIEVFKQNDSFEEAFSLSQDGESQHVPKIDMQFETAEDAHKFYNQYAFIVGFSVVKCGNYHSREKETMGMVTRMTFKCNKRGKSIEEQPSCEQQTTGCAVQVSSQGKQRKKYPILTDEAQPIPSAITRRTKVINKTNCQAEMVITLVKGRWTVTRLNLDHNHVLLPTELTKLLRSHRFFSDDEKAIIRSLVKVNVPNRKILAFLSSLRGGEEFSSVVKTDISNYRTKIQRETGCNDMTLVVQFLR